MRVIGGSAWPPRCRLQGGTSGAGSHARRKSPVNRLGWLFCRVLDTLDYRATDVRLRILDAVRGPEPETPADQQRARDRERLERALQLSPGGKSQPM
jgi:hypothetical protein